MLTNKSFLQRIRKKKNLKRWKELFQFKMCDWTLNRFSLKVNFPNTEYKHLKNLLKYIKEVWLSSEHVLNVWSTLLLGHTWTEQRACPSWLCSPRSPAGAYSDTPPVWRWPPPAAATCQTTVVQTINSPQHVLQRHGRRDSVTFTSLSISMSFFSFWCSCLVLISSTTLRLSSSCSRYSVWESFYKNKEHHQHFDVVSLQPAGGTCDHMIENERLL